MPIVIISIVKIFKGIMVMSHKCSLSTQTGKIWLIIRNNKPIDISLFTTYLSVYADEYAYIIHDGDIDTTTGCVESTHLHCVYNLKENHKKDRLSTTLNHLCKTMNYDTGIGIQIEKYDSFEGCLQYLTHKNNPVKTQHSKSEIVHNLEKEVFELYYNVDLDNIFSYERIISACLSCSNKLELIRTLWGYYSRNSTYRNVINDIWNVYRKYE